MVLLECYVYNGLDLMFYKRLRYILCELNSFILVGKISWKNKVK